MHHLHLRWLVHFHWISGLGQIICTIGIALASACPADFGTECSTCVDDGGAYDTLHEVRVRAVQTRAIQVVAARVHFHWTSGLG
jgi:hypothetical protein